MNIIVRNPDFYGGGHSAFIQDTLEKALEKANVDANFVSAVTDFSRQRLLQELISGENIHVVAHAPKPGWEENLLTIRIPLHKGLQGVRLFLINKQDQDRLSKVETLDQLHGLPTGSGAQWSITQTLRDAGFFVVTAEGQGPLYEMLRLRRILTFSRGVFEIFQELEEYKSSNKNLAVEETLAIFVPLPTYFFVSPKYPELAEQIQTGLEAMIADGSFDAHFWEYHGQEIARANLEGRRIFVIENRNLSPQTPLATDEYWLVPSRFSDDLSKDQG